MSEIEPNKNKKLELELPPEIILETVNSESDLLTDLPLENLEEKDNNFSELNTINILENDLKLDLLNNSDNDKESIIDDNDTIIKKKEISELNSKKDNLLKEIKKLEANKAKLLLENEQIQANVGKLVEEGIKELQQKKQALEITIQKLEKRQEKIEQEMKTTFAGVSQDLAIRVQGFKDFLVGSLQDLAASAEQLELQTPSIQTLETNKKIVSPPSEINSNPQFAERSFKEETKQIRRLLDQYRTKPDYYGAPWQLRRTFEPIHAERVANWFFTQGGRGAIKSMDSRLQNILVASSIMSILYDLYGDRQRTLLLTDTPERLGEWRRGLQDCLGISRSDFGPDRGVILFESPEALSQKAERIINDQEIPLIIMDQSDDQVNLSLLQFPLWLAFASDNSSQNSGYW